jgi:hypothetical protein
MTTLELSLLVGIWPIIYFLTYSYMFRNFAPGQRIVTTALQRKGEIIAVGQTHTLIEFDGGYNELIRNSLFTTED